MFLLLYTDSMDWDVCLELDESNELPEKITRKSGILIVIDTNVLISDLQLVRSLLQGAFKEESQRPHAMIPYAVLQELDSQKQRKVQPISSQAQSAIKYIHEMFKSKDKRLQGKVQYYLYFLYIIVYNKILLQKRRFFHSQSGQSSKANQAPSRIPIATNDDRILNCALQCLDNGREVVVLSNDINLRNLALMNELRAMSVAEMRVWLIDQQ